MKFYKWISSEKLGIDNDKLTESEIIKKFCEEGAEMIEAFWDFSNKPTKESLEHLYEEMFDVLQVCLCVAKTTTRYSNDNFIDYKETMLRAYENHNKKAIDRGWKVDKDKYIEIEVR
jgi:NTP pyrophosphatase (non-canonical NTP hydrolase)